MDAVIKDWFCPGPARHRVSWKVLRNIVDENKDPIGMHGGTSSSSKDNVSNSTPNQWHLSLLFYIMLVPKPGRQSPATDDKCDYHLL